MCWRLEFNNGLAKNRLSGPRLILNIIGILLVLMLGAAAAVFATYATKWWPVSIHNDNIYRKQARFDSKIVNLSSDMVADCTDAEYARQMVGRYVYRCSSEGVDDCLPMDQRCDGYEDCEDGSDEVDCDRICKTRARFTCDILNGNETATGCFHVNYRCDGEVDCTGLPADVSDEANCRDEFSIGKTGATCGDDNRWVCHDGAQCIPNHQRCDGAFNCWDESDEVGCGY